MVGQGLVSLTGQVAAMKSFATVVKHVTVDELSDSLERSALELEAKMKEGITSQSFGLAPNRPLTLKLKHPKNIPLIEGSQLLQNITTSKLIDKKPGGDDDEYRAYFVGVNRKAPMHKSTGARLASPKPISLYNIARRQVKGYTTVLPRTGVEKKVPARPFHKRAQKAHQKRHQELMKSAVRKAFSTGLKGVAG